MLKRWCKVYPQLQTQKMPKSRFLQTVERRNPGKRVNPFHWLIPWPRDAANTLEEWGERWSVVSLLEKKEREERGAASFQSQSKCISASPDVALIPPPSIHLSQDSLHYTSHAFRSENYCSLSLPQGTLPLLLLSPPRDNFLLSPSGPSRLQLLDFGTNATDTDSIVWFI